MVSARALAGQIHVENVGGIDETTVGVDPGVTVLAGRNATNRTSLLRAVMAALGSDRASLKAGVDAGQVQLELGEETYTRTFTREHGAVVTGGDPFLTDEREVELADLFAFLLESNEARRAVARGDDLRELIMRPVDTEAIRSEIDRAMRDRDRIDAELEELDDLADRLPGLEERRQELATELEDLEADLEAKRAEREAAEGGPDEAAAEQSDLEEAMAALETARDEANRTRQRLGTERDSVEALETELEELREELESLPDPAAAEDVDARLETLRDRQSRLDGVVTELQSIVEFNEKLLEGDANVREVLREDGGGVDTADLLPAAEQETVCWTCGSTVDRADIEAAIERLREVREDALAERSAVRAEIDEVTSERRERRERRQERERVERRIERAEAELAERRERIEELEAERADQRDRIEALEDEVASLQSAEQDELLAIERAVNELEFERDQVQRQLADVEDEIEAIEERLAEREDLEADREAATERLEELRDRVDRIEADAVAAFNDHMAEVLDVLDYDNLERIWIDRRTAGDTGRFELKIVRSDADGAVFEDTVDHLSESEREVTGLIFALAGYLVHDVHETVPVMLLDSIEAIDSERIARLLAYLEDFADSILVALLPEDAAAVDDDYAYVREI